MTTKAEVKNKLRLTDERLAETLGISRQAVQQWDQDKVLDRRYLLLLNLMFPRKIAKPA